METLIIALGPAFAAGLAIQQFLEIIDGFTDQVLELMAMVLGFTIDKKFVLGLISLFLGLIITIGGHLRVLAPLGVRGGEFADVLVTALIISAGTESFNSILKFLGYVKEDKKVTTQVKKQQIPEADGKTSA